MAETVKIRQVFTMSMGCNLQQRKSINHELRMKNLQPRPKRPENGTKKDNECAKSKCGWTLKALHCTVASATKEMDKIRLDLWTNAER